MLFRTYWYEKVTVYRTINISLNVFISKISVKGTSREDIRPLLLGNEGMGRRPERKRYREVTVGR